MSRPAIIGLLKAWVIQRLQKNKLFNELITYILNDPWRAGNVVIVVLLILFEVIIPLKKSSLFSRAQYEDVFWLCTSLLISFNLWGMLLYKLGDYFSRGLAGYNFNMETQPFLLQFVVFFIFSDLVSYLGHRFLHQNDYLWKFHQLHHSTKILTTLSAFRHHWFEDLYYGVFSSLLMCLFIVTPEVRLVMTLAISFACYFQHANLGIRFDPKVEWVFVTPLNHRWHHCQTSFTLKGQNFGLFLTLWDRVFKSYFVPSYEPSQLGTSEDYPKTLLRRLIYPFIK